VSRGGEAFFGAGGGGGGDWGAVGEGGRVEAGVANLDLGFLNLSIARKANALGGGL